jgi:hypothetical protein
LILFARLGKEFMLKQLILEVLLDIRDLLSLKKE